MRRGALARAGLLAMVALVMVWLGRAAASQMAPLPGTAAWGAAPTYAATWQVASAEEAAAGQAQGVGWVAGRGLLPHGPAAEFVAPPLEPAQPVWALVAEWESEGGPALPLLALRWRTGAGWQPWQPIEADSDGAPSPSSAPLLAPPGASAFQWRLRWPAEASTVAVPRVLLGSLPGEGVAVAAAALSTVPLPGGGPGVVPRSAWGVGLAAPTWRPEASRPQAIIVHHTVTSDGGHNGAAVVRAIDVFHRVTRGWGDVGYHFLIDRQGTIYAGRQGGAESVGAHAYGFNEGTVGIALLGSYEQAQPTPAAEASLVALSAWLSRRFELAPTGTVRLRGQNLPTIMGHRDTGRQTLCPGEALWDALPGLRQRVAAALAEGPPLPPPGIQLAPPATWQRGPIALTVTSEGDSVALRLDQQALGGSAPPFRTLLEPGTLADGPHTLVATATRGTQRAEATLSFQVDNSPPRLVARVEGDAAIVQAADGASGLAWLAQRHRRPDGTWSDWQLVAQGHGHPVLEQRAALIPATTLQWLAGDQAGNLVESALLEP